jgi:phage protein U
MASAPLMSPSQLLTLGMFLFGMDTIPYSDFQRSQGWRHEGTERHMARPATQFVGPGEDSITLAGLLVPEIAGSYGALDRLVEMADTGDNWPLVDGSGRVLGHFRIDQLDTAHHTVLAGGIPRAIDFQLRLTRVD